MKIIEIGPDSENFNLFKQVPKNLYKEQFWPLLQDEDINLEFLHSAFVLLDPTGLPVGRCILYKNPHLIFENKITWAIGNYECIDNKECSNYFITYIFDIGKKLGAEYLVGPMNGSTWNNYRFSMNNDIPNFFSEPYHHEYYNQHFIENGFKPIQHYFSKKDTTLVYDHSEIINAEQRLFSIGVKIRNFDHFDFDNEIRKIYTFSLKAFRDNFLFTPVSFQAFTEKFGNAMKMISSDKVLIAENSNKELVGFIFSFDDFYNKSEKCLILKTVARDDAQEYKGLGQVLVNCMIRYAAREQYDHIIQAFIKDETASDNASLKFSGDKFKFHTLYGKNLL